MKNIARLRSWLRASFQRSRINNQLDEEIRLHIERSTEDLIRSGFSPEEARRRARAEFGVIEARKDECRDALGLRLFDDLLADCRYAARILRQSPAFTIVAILSLALGIGANTAIFTLMEAVLWKTVPVKNPEQLRLLSWASGPKNVVHSTWGGRQLTPGGVGSTVFSYSVFRALQQITTGTQAVFVFKPSGRMTAEIDGHAELVTSELVSGNFYASVGVMPIAGRPITLADDKRTAAGVVAVISDGFWSRRFGWDVSVLGRAIYLNQVPVTVVGINSSSFKGMEPGGNPDIFLPLSAQPVILPFQWAMNKSGSVLERFRNLVASAYGPSQA